MLFRGGFNTQPMVKKLQSGNCYVQISAALVLLVLLSSPNNLMAQGRGGGRRGGGGAGAPASAGADPNSMKDFERAIAVQATDDQSAHFTAWAKSAESARKLTTDLTRETESAKDGKALSSQIAALKDAVDETQSTQEQFLRSFSNAQKTGLKEFTKKLEKADSAVLKALKTLDEDSGRSNINSKQIASSAEKLEQALTSFQSEQHRLGEEMGIQSSPSKTAAN
jgi:hypothetical protein